MNELTILESGLYFIVVFSITMGLCYLVEKGRCKYSTIVIGKFRLFDLNFAKISVLFLAAQPLVYMFASRSLNVGTDLSYTYYPYYYQGYCINGKAYDGIEYGFIMLFRFAYKLSKTFNGCLWIIGEFLIVIYLLICKKILKSIFRLV